MAAYGNSAAEIFFNVVGTINDDGKHIFMLFFFSFLIFPCLGTVFVLKALETLLTLYPREAPVLIEKVLNKILNLTLSDSESDVAITHYLSIFARIALQNMEFFVSLLFNPCRRNYFDTQSYSFLRASIINLAPIYYRRF